MLYFRRYDKTLFNRIFGVQILVFLGISLFLGFIQPYVDNVGHIGGLIGGYLAARSVGLLSQIFDEKRHVVLCYVGYGAVFAALIIIGVLF